MTGELQPKSVDEVTADLTTPLQPSPMKDQPLPEVKGVSQQLIDETGERMKQAQAELSAIPDDQLDEAMVIAKKRRNLQRILNGEFTPTEYAMAGAGALLGAILKGCVF